MEKTKKKREKKAVGKTGRNEYKKDVALRKRGKKEGTNAVGRHRGTEKRDTKKISTRKDYPGGST